MIEQYGRQFASMAELRRFEASLPPTDLALRLERAFHKCWTSQTDHGEHAYNKEAFTEFQKTIEEVKTALRTKSKPVATGPLTLDTDQQVFFYEQEHYYLSNFSAFTVRLNGKLFPTSEHAYQHAKFIMGAWSIACDVHAAPSAHEAFKIAEKLAHHRRPDWDAVKVGTMRDIIRAKASQHEYVRRKLLETGDRELIENSWRDPFWGWGPNRDGKNVLGRLWMEIRADLRVVYTADVRSERHTGHEPDCADCPDKAGCQAAGRCNVMRPSAGYPRG